MNSITVIYVYRKFGTWVFDDPSVGLNAEAFVAGIPEIIEHVVREIGMDLQKTMQNGFTLTFSSTPFPWYNASLTWVSTDGTGNTYKLDGTEKTGWLCPALFKYWDKAPANIFCHIGE
jgi:hypothetical protein